MTSIILADNASLTFAKPRSFIKAYPFYTTYACGEIVLNDAFMHYIKPQSTVSVVVRFSYNLHEKLWACNLLQRFLAVHGTAINWIIPYFPYSREDKDTNFSSILREGLKNVFQNFSITCVDAHSDAYQNIWRNLRSLSIAQVFAHDIKQRFQNCFIVSPDRGGQKRCKEIATILNCPYVVLQKIRAHNTVEVNSEDLSEYKGLQPVIVDDIFATGSTLKAVSNALKKQGFQKIHVYVTHCLNQNPSVESFDSLTTSNSLYDSYDKVRCVDVSSLFTNSLELSAAQRL